jgi:hypothetical protein
VSRDTLDVLIKVYNNQRSSQENLCKFFYDDMYRTYLRYTDDPNIALIDQLQEPGNDDFQLNYEWNYSEMQEHFRHLPTVNSIVIN